MSTARGAALRGGSCSGPPRHPASSWRPSAGAAVAAGSAGAPGQNRAPDPACTAHPSLAGRWEDEGGWGPQTRCFTEPQPGMRELEANRQTKLYLGFSWSWPTIPKLQPVLGQSTREGNPSPPLHRENHCMPQHFSLRRVY